MIHQLADAYHWSFDDICKRTMPQIILLGHASSVQYQRTKNKTDKTTINNNEPLTADQVIVRGKKLSELTEVEQIQYYSGDGWGNINFM